MEENHKKELYKAMDLFKFSMYQTDPKNIYFLLKEAHSIFMEVWTVYMERMLTETEND